MNLVAGTSVRSPELLKVQWKVTIAGLASTWHRNVTVSCFNAPNSSSRSCMHTGASGKGYSGQSTARNTYRNENLKLHIPLIAFAHKENCNLHTPELPGIVRFIYIGNNFPLCCETALKLHIEFPVIKHSINSLKVIN